MTVFSVGVGKDYATVGAAVAATHDGDTVLVQAGTYLNDFATITTKITLQSVGGLAVMDATQAPPNGKAILTVDNDVTIDGFGFTGAAVSDGNGAGIRFETGNLTVKNSVFWLNQDGILTASDPTSTLTISNSEFSQNGTGDGYTHNLYVGQIKSATITNSYFHDAVGGHEIKSRAFSTTITGNRIMENQGDGSYDIDLPNGGQGLISNNVIEKGENAPNYTTIHFGGEGTPYAGSALTISNNTIVNDNPNGFLLNNAAAAPVTLSNNSIWGYAPDHVLQGGAAQVTQSGTTVLATRPTLNQTSMAPTVLDAPANQVLLVPDATTYTTFGTAGAVVATGHLLTVGAKGQFQTLATALAASSDGDTIQVAAGTYTNDFGTVNHKVIIQGVGGIARFVQSGAGLQPLGVLTVNTDVTLQNLEFAGGHGGSNSHEGGVTISAGNTTIVNSKFDNNDVGITATGGNTTVSVFGSEIGNNGNFDKDTPNILMAGIGSFTLQNSYVHDATTGHEVSDRAANAVIQGNRIIDGPTTASSYQIGVGQGGNAIISNNVIEKGHNSVNDNVVMVGGEGTPFSNTNVQINNNTLVSDMVWADHPYTYFLAATGAALAAGPVTANGNTFVGGVKGSAQAVGVTATNSRVAASAVLDTSSPVSGALAPVGFNVTSGVNRLLLNLSEVKGAVDAQFIVSVDGKAIGGGLVTSATSQAFTFAGVWPTGNHTVTVTGTNLYSGRDINASIAATSLKVLSVSMDSNTVSQPTVLNTTTNAATFNIGGTTRLPDFDAIYYLAHNPDVAASHVDPLTHYMTSGWKEGRDPSALFSTKGYLAANPDVAASGVNPLLQYETVGWTQGRNPSALFNGNAWRAAHLSADPMTDPLQLYTQSGDTKVYSDPLVNAQYYQTQGFSTLSSVASGVVATSVTAAAAAYHAGGWQAGKDPSAWFETGYYQWANPDVAKAGIDPLAHYEQYGFQENRSANPWFSASAYTAAHPQIVGTKIDPLLAFLESSEATASPQTSPYLTPEAKMFDAAFYLQHNPDVLAAHIDPLYHYERYGWVEGRDPSAAFDGNKYLAANADVKAAHIDPLAHYAGYGQNEGRSIFPA